MSRFSRSVRIAVAGLLAVSALTIFGASPASAAATGSLVDNGDGSATITYSGVTVGDDVVVLGLPSGTTCTAQTGPFNATFFLTTDPQAPGGAMPASPMTIQAGTSAFSTGNPPGAMTIAAGTYNLCVQNLISQQSATVVQQLQVTLGSVAPTTTTTTAPAADPVAPAFTG
jgi:hypothetical protein